MVQTFYKCKCHVSSSTTWDLDRRAVPFNAIVQYRGEDYKLFWPERGEFVRLAVDSGAIIVPFSAVGIADR